MQRKSLRKTNYFGGFKVGDRVRTWLRESGTIECLVRDPGEKPFVVRMDDGRECYYLVSQVRHETAEVDFETRALRGRK